MASEEAESNKQQKEECIINYLPRDIIERVFFRLPPSTLLRCIGVCKLWQSFIQDPQFVTSHLRHAPRYALIFFPQESISGKLYPSDAILIDETWSQSTCAVPVIGPDDFLFGSCNGLLGLYTRTSTIKIANFATGDCLHLEKPAKDVKGDHFSFYSFGFHPVTKEYKIAHFLSDSPHNKDRFSVIQVYTLGDEKWKNIQTPEALSLKCVRNYGVVNADGMMYWLTEDMIASWQHAVMSFDLNEESFSQIQLPTVLENCAHGGPRRCWIREIDGKICLATAQTSRYLQIWTLDNKTEHRWSQKYNIQHPSGCILGPNLVHGDNIIMQQFGGNLCSYELLGENFEVNMVKLFYFSPRKPQFHNCVKSLVCLDAFKNTGIVRRPKRRDGWELKKWETWEWELSEIETMWGRVYEEEHKQTALAPCMHTKLNRLLPQVSDDVMRQQIGMKINQISAAFPDQQPRSLRRLNWVEQQRDVEKLFEREEKYMDITKAMAQEMDSIIDVIISATQNQEKYFNFKIRHCFTESQVRR